MKVLKRYYISDYTVNGETRWKKKPRNFYIGNGKEIFRLFRNLEERGYVSAYEYESKFDTNKTYILWVNREFVWNGKPTIFYDCDAEFITLLEKNEVK